MQTNEWKTVKVHPQLHAVIKSQAAAAGMSLHDLVELILTDWARRRAIPVPHSRRSTDALPDLFLNDR